MNGWAQSIKAAQEYEQTTDFVKNFSIFVPHLEAHGRLQNVRNCISIFLFHINK